MESSVVTHQKMRMPIPTFAGIAAAIALLVISGYAYQSSVLQSALLGIDQEAGAQISRIFAYSWAIFGLICVLVAFGFAALRSYYLRDLSHHLTSIAENVERCAKGNFSFPVATVRMPGMDRIVGTLKSMVEELDERLRTVREQHHERTSILFSISEGVVAVDAEHRLLLLNEAASQIFAVDQYNARGESLDNVAGTRQLTRMVEEIIENGFPQRKEMTLTHCPKRTFEIKGSVLKNADYKTLGVVLVLNDITQLRQLESVRRDFVANVSHELRTPITSIQGFVETLLDGALEDTSVRNHFLEIVLHQSKRLRKIIEDLLALARVENTQEECHIDTTSVALGEVLDAVSKLCSERAKEKQITLSVVCDDRDALIRVNRLLIEQALVNLVNNGINYSGGGARVELTAELFNGNVAISVRDFGIGIAKEHIPRLFERFYRVDKGRSREEGGSGLGLAIVKHIAMVHGGSVTVESKQGEGSTFSVLLPQRMQTDTRAVANG